MNWIVSLLLFFAGAYLQFRVAEKLKHPRPWVSFIPIANLFQILVLGKVSPGVIFYTLIPIVGPFIFLFKLVKAFKEIGVRCGLSENFGVLLLLPIIKLWAFYQMWKDQTFFVEKKNQQGLIKKMIKLIDKGVSEMKIMGYITAAKISEEDGYKAFENAKIIHKYQLKITDKPRISIKQVWGIFWVSLLGFISLFLILGALSFQVEVSDEKINEILQQEETREQMKQLSEDLGTVSNMKELLDVWEENQGGGVVAGMQRTLMEKVFESMGVDLSEVVSTENIKMYADFLNEMAESDNPEAVIKKYQEESDRLQKVNQKNSFGLNGGALIVPTSKEEKEDLGDISLKKNSDSGFYATNVEDIIVKFQEEPDIIELENGEIEWHFNYEVINTTKGFIILDLLELYNNEAGRGRSVARPYKLDKYKAGDSVNGTFIIKSASNGTHSFSLTFYDCYGVSEPRRCIFDKQEGKIDPFLVFKKVFQYDETMDKPLFIEEESLSTKDEILYEEGERDIVSDSHSKIDIPHDLAGNRIWNLLWHGEFVYAKSYCQIIEGKTTYESFKVASTLEKVCRCDNHFGCNGESCTFGEPYYTEIICKE